jgi:metal-responsive CopG/Arc/MetJ family transcriptional regulator
MRSRQTVSVSLPREMFSAVERVREAEHRTRSELLRDALRTYLGRHYPAVDASAADLQAIQRGRAAYKRGEYVTLEELVRGLGNPRHSSGRKRA